MITQIAPDVRWIGQCIDEKDRHMHVSQYLLRGDDGDHVLIDTGSTYRREETMADIERGLDGGRIAVVLLTHSTLPHTENLGLIDERWEDVDIVAATNNPTVTGLRNYAEGIEPKVLNEAREFAGRRFSFLDPLITDVVSSNWIYDHDAGILFTAEGLGHYHGPGECDLVSGEMTDGIAFEDVHAFQRDKLPFLKFVDPTKLQHGIDTLFGNLDVDTIAPIHGNPVVRDDIDEYLRRVGRSTERIAEDWSAPSASGD
jgi:flavorubredoxin